LGPGGGGKGGEVVAEGPPEEIVREPRSFTGQYLKPLLERANSSPAQAGAQVAKPKPRRKASADQSDLIAAK
jgi:excinuclease ABC subunit A